MHSCVKKSPFSNSCIDSSCWYLDFTYIASMSGVGWGWGLGRARGTSLRIHLENRESIRCSHARSMDVDRLRRKHRHQGPPLDTSVRVLNEDFANTYMCGSRGGGGGQGSGPPPLENYKNIGFLCNTGRDSLKNHKATKPALHVAIIGPPAKRHLNGVSQAGR